MPVAGAHYSSTKARLIGMTRTLAGEARRDNIPANCIAGHPHPRQATARAATARGTWPAYRSGGSVSRTRSRAVSFLASDGAAFVTGAVIDANASVFS